MNTNTTAVNKKCTRCYRNEVMPNQDLCESCNAEVKRIVRMQELDIQLKEALLAGSEQLPKSEAVETTEEAKERRDLYVAELRDVMAFREWYREVAHPQMIRATIIAGALASGTPSGLDVQGRIADVLGS